MVFTGITGINNCVVMSFYIKWIYCSKTWMSRIFMVTYGFLDGLCEVDVELFYNVNDM